jgi:stage II sporulation protein M
MKNKKYERFFGGLYRRNEIFLWLSAGIFFASVFIGYIFSGALDQILGSILGGLKKKITEGKVQLNTLSLFTNNLLVALAIYAGGVTIGIGTAYFLIWNGAFFGYAASQYPPLSNFLILTVPHGIFEIAGIIISGAAGFRLASAVFHILDNITKIKSDISLKDQLNYILELNSDELKESVVLFAIAAGLLLLAAFIEANLTIIFANYIKGLI